MRVYRRSTAVSVVLALVAGLMAGLPPVAVAAAAPGYVEPSVPVKPGGGKAPAVAQPPMAQPKIPVWPTAGSAQVSLDGPASASTADGATVSGTASPGGLPVTVRAAAASSTMSDEQAEWRMMRGLPVGSSNESGVSAVDVTVLDQTATARLGVKGVVFTAAPSSSSATAGSAPVEFSVSYQAFGHAYGGGYADRLRLVSLPACALSTPQLPACQVQTPVPAGFNDNLTATVSAPVDLASGGGSSPASTGPASASESSSTSDSASDAGGVQVLAVTAGASSEQGDWGATSLSQAGSWQAGSSGGGFSYSVPVTVPPAPGGLTPKISFDYSSAGVDGLSKSTSSQASWIGEGWNFEPGFVERSFRPCRLDGQPSDEGDLCWVSASPVTVSLNGTSTRLFRNDADGSWKAEDDSAGWRVARVTGLANGARDGEAFTITTRDGTEYRFGSQSPNAYGGVLNVEVFGNNPGEPCYNGGGFRYSHCPMPYRWNLDQVQDVHGNVIDYQWWKFHGSYGGNNGDDVWVYDIHGRLGSIEYGRNVNAGIPGEHHTGKVTFDVTGRCFASQAECDDPAKRHLWMDTPWDQHCQTWATSCGVHTPTFWNLYRLINISTYVWDPALGGGVGGFPTDLSAFVDQFATTQGFAATGDFIAPAGDDSAPSLWMSHLWLPGFTAPMEFGGMALDNRVDYGTGKPPMRHWRVSLVNSGTAEYVYVDYSVRDCNGSSLPAAADQNTRRCYGQKTAEQLSWWHRYVVTDVTSRDYAGGAPDERWHYDYSTANSSTAALWKIDQNWHQPPSERTWSRWAGYPTVYTTHGAADGSGPQQVTESLFYRGMHWDATFAGFDTRLVDIDDGWDHNIPDYQALAGQTRRTSTFNGPGGAWTGSVRHHHQVTPTGSQAIQSNPTIIANRVRETETLTGTVLAGPAYRWTHTVSTYDTDYGLPTKVEDHGDTDVAGDERCVLTSYTEPNTGKWLIGLPYERVTTNCATNPAAGDYLGGTQFFYDYNISGSTPPTSGLVTKSNALAVTPAPQPGPTNWKQASAGTYDVYGRVLDSFDALNRKSSTAYVPATGGPTVELKLTGPMGAGWTTTSTLDPRRGLPTKVVDVNGKTTQAEYDADGRLLKVWKNNRVTAMTPDVEYSYSVNGDNWVTTKALGPNDTKTATGGTTHQITSHQIFDGRLRPRQTQAPAANGTGRTITDIAYNGLGVAEKTTTFYNTSAPGTVRATFEDKDVKVQQRLVFDNLGRTTAQQQWTGDGTTSSKLFETVYTFDGDQTITMTPPAGGTATTTINDVRGQTVELRQHVGGTPAGAVDVTTKYSYDRLGQLTKVTDTANNVWTYTYDLRGRKVSTADPDAGTSTTTFDDAGQATSTKDSRNLELYFEYDNLGRKTKQREGSVGGLVMAEWTYDSLAKGLLTSTSRFIVGGDTYTSAVGSYDDYYRPMSTTDTIPGFGTSGSTLTYTVNNTYKPNGAIATQAFPAVGGLPAETVTPTYHASTGLPNSITSNANGSTTYVASTSYFYDGKPDTVILGGTGKRIKQTSTFDAATRRLTNNSTATETTTVGTYSTKLSDTYTYDNAGNIKSIAGQTNGVADQEECFTYDHLQRLTEAWTQTSGACTTPQRTGADPYRRQWPTSGGYDKLGNRLKQIDKDTTDTTWNYTIGGIDSCGGASKPHAVTSIAATGPKAGTPTRTFCYDAAGNTTKRTTDTGVVQTLTWDKEGHLATLADGTLTTSYTYDSSGRRLIASNADKSTLYLPDGTELEKIGTANPLGQRYYGLAVRDAGGLKWIISNHQSTGTAQIDSLTLTINQRRSMPFGEPRGTQPTWLGTKGYVGGTKDDTGLTHLGAREYDPTTGRFISADPLMDLTDPQQWNAYLYSHNNPVTFSDPTGLIDTCDNDGGTCSTPPRGPQEESTSASGGNIKCYSGNKSPDCQGYGVVTGDRTFEQFFRDLWGFDSKDAIGTWYMKIAMQEYFCSSSTPEACQLFIQMTEAMMPDKGTAMLKELLGVADLENCFGGGGTSSCFWLAASLVPGSRLPKITFFGTKIDNISEHVSLRDLEAARRELNGEVVARKADGTPWDHVAEVRDAQRGLLNVIDRINRELASPGLSPTDRVALTSELSRASIMLDHTEKYVPRP